MNNSSTIIGTGTAFPGEPISTEKMAKVYGFNLEWANHFIGTASRYFAVDMDNGVQYDTLTSLGFRAVRQALDNAQVDIGEIDFLILATATPDELMPSTANRVAVELGLSNIPIFQIQSGCAGAVQALDLGRHLLSVNRDNSIGVVVGGDVCAKHLDMISLSDKEPGELINYLLFGDGVGAAIITSASDRPGLRIDSVVNETTNLGGSPGQIIRWFGQSDLSKGDGYSHEALYEDYKAIERLVPVLAKHTMTSLLQDTGWTTEQVKWLLPPQLSGRATEYITNDLDIPKAKVISCVADLGNCGNALPFIQFDQLINRIEKGEHAICLCIESSMWIKGGIAITGGQR